MNLDRTLLDRRLDHLLAPWANDTGPGATIGVVHDGNLVAHRHAGLASVEHRVPIGPTTRFRIASVSKQFTCAAILMLAHDNALAIQDDIRTHLPELPDTGHRITLAHLMHNTSGIRDMLELMRQAGADLGTPIHHQDLVDAIARQRTLNFPPGTRFLYSNSNFLLLGLVVERATGQPLPTWLEHNIFTPLGMNATRLTPDPFEAIPDLATGYFPKGPGWTRAPHAFPLHGEGGLVSTVQDLALWDRNLDRCEAGAGRVGGNWLATALATQTPFANGTENRYARGQVIRPHRGLPTISHGGLWPGYRTEYLRLPSHRITVIAIANTGASDPNLLAHQALDALLDAHPEIPRAPALPTPQSLHPLLGRWIDPAASATLDIALDAANRPTLTTNGLTVTAEATDDGRIAAPRANGVLAVRSTAPDTTPPDTIEVEQDAAHTTLWRRAPEAPTLPEGLPGAYRSDELAATWTIAATPHGLRARATGPVATGQPWDIEPVDTDLVRIHIPGTLYRAWLDVRVLRDPHGAVVALESNGGRVKNLRLTRL